VFVRGKLFQPSQTFEGKVRANPSGAPFSFSLLPEAFGLTCSHKTSMEKLDKDKHPSLFRRFVNYGRKKYYNIDPRSEMLLEGWETPRSLVPDFMLMTNSVKFQFGTNKLECLILADLFSLV